MTSNATSDRPARLLLVDDDVLYGRALARRLRRGLAADGIFLNVEQVGSAAEARTTPPGFDAALVDVGLPDGDGVTVLRAWRSSRRWRSLPVLMISGSAIDSVAAASWLLGAPAIPKTEDAGLVECARKLVRDAIARPRTALDELRRFATALADEVGLSPALRDVLMRRAVGQSLREIAEQRGRSLDTIERQSKDVNRLVLAVGIDLRRDGVSALLHEVLEARYDDE